ncbi:aldo/keto reductase [Pseudomonas benzenivorans]|uniref:Aldo/keto reductase n=1 Tax=Pseudomonas benzenivorans TaxID=556533 RepID=A0ABY5H599_9PSED|nr:aldo/keto reductase [Pseudomonas benzenivorans]UTW07483.1 aldo/keto reductase [Pseudomonas benzenivorans]
MKSVAVLQARTNSSRLPGKVLLPINGIPLVVLAAKRAANTDRKVIVATSQEASDDALAAIIEGHGLACSRGSLENTLERVVHALSGYDDNTIVFRLTADNIFPDGSLLDEIEQDFIKRKLDYLCCNGEPSGLPYGMSAEITRLGHLREAARNSSSKYDQEHVTPYIIRKFGSEFFESYRSLNKGHFRCTIDCFDDYLGALRLFSNFDDAIHADPFDLIKYLESSPYQPMGSQPVPRLVLGAAQLGSNYGVANKIGQPSSSLSQELIKTAIANGVVYLDTARAYGNSEEIIGQALKSGWEGRVKIITKLSPLLECPADASTNSVRAFVDASIYQSCSALRVQSLDVLMLHRVSHIDEWDGAVWQRLQELLESGVIKELGVSIQSPEELEKALSELDLTFIQMPVNILDWRWDSIIPKIRAVKLERKLIIHVRSALLQGLLQSSDPRHWLKANVENAEVIIQWMKEQVELCSRLNIADLCLSYINSLDWVDGIAVGMESMQQLKENIEIFCRPVIREDEINKILASRPRLEESTLNPALWRMDQQ